MLDSYISTRVQPGWPRISGITSFRHFSVNSSSWSDGTNHRRSTVIMVGNPPSPSHPTQLTPLFRNTGKWRPEPPFLPRPSALITTFDSPAPFTLPVRPPPPTPL